MADVISVRQVRVTMTAVRWYLDYHYRSADDPGIVQNFADPRRVGAFAISTKAVARWEPAALYRLLTAVVMFQRRQDRQITAILRGITPEDAEELSAHGRLQTLADVY